jgi:primary-amine oxidase
MRGNLLLLLGLAGISAAASINNRPHPHPGHGDQGPPGHIKAPGGKPPKTVKPGNPNKPVKDSCLAGETPTVKAPKSNVWAQITPEDNRAVWNLLHDPKTGLNLTAPGTAKHTDNYVFWIDSVPTNKTSVLPYLDGEAPAPAKYARAVIFEGGLKEPRSQEYMIGPLPVGPKTTVQPLDYMYNGGTGGAIPYNGRYFDGKRSSASEPLIAQTMAGIADITQALFGGAYFGSGDSRTNLSSTSGTPLSLDGSQAFRNIMFRYPSQSTYLTPIDFYLLVDVSGTDPSLYKVLGFVTKERFFPTVEELRAAFEAGELEQEFPQERDAPWAVLDYKPELGTRDLEDRFAPSSVELGGKRYKLDKEAQYVEYMNWSFYIAFTRTVGIQFFDIKFKGERILYELSLQEAMAQYAGNQPKAANTGMSMPFFFVLFRSVY